VALPLWLTKLLIRTRLARFSRRAGRLTDGGTSYLRYYSDRVLTAPVEGLLDPAYFPDPAGPGVFDLNQPAPRSASGVSLGRFTTERGGNPPAAGLPELRAAIAARYHRIDGRRVDPATEVLVTHGATGAFATALDAFVNPGDRVVLFDPCSPLFALGAKSRRARVRWVPTWTEDGRSRYVSREFETAMRGATMLVLSDPANPAGGVFSDEELDHIAWIAAAYDVLVYADESFSRFRYDARGKCFGKLPGADRRILTAGSMTQEFGLGSLRVGWLVGPRHLVRACGLTQNLSAPFVPVVCQQAAARALAEPDHEFGPALDSLRRKRDYAVERLRAMGLELDRPAGGYFLWVPVAGLGLDGRAFAERLFREERVQVGPGCVYGPSGTGHVRVSLAGDDGRLREGLSRMTAFVEKLKNPAPKATVQPVIEEMVETNPAEVGEKPLPTFSRA
jgi:aspartate/methionine/tyrosine aminotransferase